MARSRDISKVLSSNSTLATDAEVAASYLSTASANALYAPVAAGGLVQITPTSIATTGGSATSSISATGSVSFTGASSIALNNCFSSTYKNYFIICNMQGSTYTYFNMRLRTATDFTGGSYNIQRSSVSNTTYAATRATLEGSFVQVADISADRVTDFTMNIFNPNTTDSTELRSLGVSSSSGNLGMFDTLGSLNTSTQYTGFNLIVNSGTVSGAISVYGYRN
jgi:hypothetical protein